MGTETSTTAKIATLTTKHKVSHILRAAMLVAVFETFKKSPILLVLEVDVFQNISSSKFSMLFLYIRPSHMPSPSYRLLDFNISDTEWTAQRHDVRHCVMLEIASCLNMFRCKYSWFILCWSSSRAWSMFLGITIFVVWKHIFFLIVRCVFLVTYSKHLRLLSFALLMPK